jgi:hypothetical protein
MYSKFKKYKFTAFLHMAILFRIHYSFCKVLYVYRPQILKTFKNIYKFLSINIYKKIVLQLLFFIFFLKRFFIGLYSEEMEEIVLFYLNNCKNFIHNFEILITFIVLFWKTIIFRSNNSTNFLSLGHLLIED